jgi:4-hydroxy-3-polyprenylbenzoate decarboxylase
MTMKRYVVALTGASGTIYGIRLVGELLKAAEVHLVISESTFPILLDETGLDWSASTESAVKGYFRSDRVCYHDDRRMWAPIASGSFKTDGMLIVPCSMKTLSGIASGYAHNLIERAADVTIKEGRRLLLSPREMPFSAIHLDNMLSLARLGVMIAPPVPAFYSHPEKIDDVVNFVVGKILDCMGIDHRLFPRWGGSS